MNQKTKAINEYFSNHKKVLFIAVLLGMIFLLMQEIPYFNLLLPSNFPLVVVLFSTIIFLDIHRKPIFFLILLFITIVLYFVQGISLAEQVSNLIFVLIFILAISCIISFYKDINRDLKID